MAGVRVARVKRRMTLTGRRRRRIVTESHWILGGAVLIRLRAIVSITDLVLIWKIDLCHYFKLTVPIEKVSE